MDKLNTDLKDAKQQLNDRIKKGNALLKRGEETLHALRDRPVDLGSWEGDVYTWDEFNAALLQKLFLSWFNVNWKAGRLGLAG